MLGETLGSYRVLSPIGQGGMGEVYLAEHALIGRRVAIKVLLPQYSADLDIVTRFFNEARAAARLQHPGLVEVFDFGHAEDGRAYIVMELLVGESLSVRIAREKRFAPALALAIMRQIALALEAAHQKGIIHRDLKPENLFLITDPDAPGGVRVKVLDFGIAKLVRDDEAPRSVKTKTGAVFGTPRYMAPEQCKNAGNVDGRADMYGLGCITFEMLLGRAPFDYDSWGELVAAHIHLPAPRPRDLDPEIPPAIDALVTRTLAKDPADRFATMAELADALEQVWRAAGEHRASLFTPPKGLVLPRRTAPNLLGDAVSAPTLPVAAELSKPPPPTPIPARRRRSRVLLVVGSVVMAAGATILVVALHGGDASPPQVATAPLPPGVESAPPQPPPIPPPSGSAVDPMIELSVDSIPSGADVYRRSDGVKLGKTPYVHRFSRVDGGEIDLLLKRSGYQDKQLALSTASDSKQVVKLVAVHAPKPVDHGKPAAGSNASGPTFLDPYAGSSKR